MSHPTLPTGWTMEHTTEVVTPPPGITPFFARSTWNGYNPKGEWVAGSQSEEDCYAQLLSNYQCRQEAQ